MKNDRKKTWSSLKRVLNAVLCTLLILVCIVLGYFGFLTVIEYTPADIEELAVLGNDSNSISTDNEVTILAWNIGYGALGNNADFFMDGGKSVYSSTKERVQQNLTAISDFISNQNPDIALLQEVDIDSSRSYHIDEAQVIQQNTKLNSYTYATNYQCFYVPYPIPPIGKTESGLVTLSNYDLSNSQRYSLPCPFAWPIRLGNLKRCMNVSRLPLEDSDAELVIINFHLEAYDDGSGKIEQTKKIIEILHEEVAKGNYVVAGGDFNQTFDFIPKEKVKVKYGTWKPGIIMAKDFEPEFNVYMDEATPSCRSLDKPYVNCSKDNMQYYYIDGFIVSSNIDVEDFHIVDLDFVNSDHNPVFIKIKLR